MFFTLLFSFALGLVIGSFLNVVVYRTFNKSDNKNLRSVCPHCKHTLGGLDLIPIISYLLLRGRCRYCSKPISQTYLFGEVSTGLTFVLLTWYFGQDLALWVFSLVIFSILITLFFSDLYYGILPDKFILVGLIVTILFRVFKDFYLGERSLVSSFITAIIACLFFYSFVYFSKGKAMGGGDVKLAFLLGLLLGFPKIVAGLFLAFLTGAFVSVILIIFRVRRIGQTVPFGPFLVVGALISYIWGNQIISQYFSYLMR